MRLFTVSAALVALAAGGALAPRDAFAAPNLTGTWEVQTMGADRSVAIKQKGTKLVAHRVLWPEFEGEKYKLEHLYRGIISGGKIRGELLVREDELPKYEVLRSFTGSVTSGDRITIDGLPMKRSADASDDALPAATPELPTRPSEPPSFSRATPPAAAPAAATAYLRPSDEAVRRSRQNGCQTSRS